MPDFTQLQNRYQQLPKDEQFILRMLSVFYIPANQTMLNDVMKRLAVSSDYFAAFETQVDRHLKDKLEDAGLISIASGRLTCNPELEAWLSIEAVRLGEFEPVTAFALTDFPLLSRYGYVARLDDDETRRALRIALFSGDVPALLKQLEIDEPWAEPPETMTRALLDICGRTIHLTWLQEQHPAVMHQILRPILDNSIINGYNATAFYEIATQLAAGLDEPPLPLRMLIARQRLWRGDWQSLEAELAAVADPEADLLLASLSFLKGETTETARCFDAFISRRRKETRKRNILIEGLPGVIYVLTLLKLQADDDLPADERRKLIKAAELQFRLNEKEFRYDGPGHQESQTLKHVFNILTGKRAFNEDLFLADSYYATPLGDLIRALALHWHGSRPEPRYVERLIERSATVRQAGWPWLADEIDHYLIRLGEASINTPERPAQLLDVIPILEEWERALKALADIPAPAPKKKKTSATTGAARLIWMLEEDDWGELNLGAKEQKQKKNGSWSTGRTVSLKRLKEEPGQFSYLTDQDKAICKWIRQRKEYSYYGQGKTVYSLNRVEALMAASGHPNLYMAGQPGQQAEIVTGTPALRVLEIGNEIQLILEPYNDDYEYVIDRESPSRFCIYPYSEQLRHIAQIVGEEGLSVPANAKDRVLKTVSAIAPLLTVHSDVDGVSAQAGREVEADPRIHVHLQPMGEGLQLSFHVQPFGSGPVISPGRGGETLFTEVNDEALQTRRDLNLEVENLQAVLAVCNNLYETSPGNWQWQDADDALTGLLALQTLGEQVVLNWPEGKSIRLSRPAEVKDMSVSLRQKTDWFEVDGELRLDDDQVFSMQALLELIGTRGERFVKLGQGEFLTLTNELRQKLDELASYSDDGRIHALNAVNLEDSIDGMSVDADKAWAATKTRLQAARDLEPVLPSTLQADLRDYQVDGFNWLSRLSTWGAGACLADDMGLGKTLQALALAVQRAPEGPALVIAPSSVCTNWIEEAQRFAPTLNPIRFGAGDRRETLAELGPFDLLICSYGLLQSEAKMLQAVNWHTIVADEAQAFKNAATKRSKAIMGLEGDFRMIATGTPIENHLGELWNLFQFINPGLLGSRDTFNEKFAWPIENQKDASAAAALKRLISPFILRRLKRDVLTELPPRTEITLRVDLGEEELTLYEALRLEAVNQLKDEDMQPNQQRIRALASIMKLRRAVCNPAMVMPDVRLPSAKLEAFDNVLTELLENRHKVLVFSQFVDHLSLIRDHLDAKGVTYQYLDGSSTTKQRNKSINAFQAGDGDVFLISLKAGGVGLNLTAADYVIHMDPWWNPAVEDQASDRAHRIGQQRPVTVYRLVASGTIEEKIVDLHAHKRDLADSLLQGSEVSARMSLTDMLALIDDQVRAGS